MERNHERETMLSGCPAAPCLLHFGTPRVQAALSEEGQGNSVGRQGHEEGNKILICE